jgi:two-component system, NtrC family, sensor kinase
MSLAAKNITLKGIHILVVDDSEDLREMIELVLKAKGASVACARDGAEAISMSEANPYDLIVMDMRMPGLNGKETAAAIKRRQSHTKIVALSGDLDASTQIKDEGSSPFDAFIPKPVDPHHLSAKIFETLEDSASKKEGDHGAEKGAILSFVRR